VNARRTTEHAVDITHEEAGSLNMLFSSAYGPGSANVVAKIGMARWPLGFLNLAGDDPLAEGIEGKYT
jgi:hypothetical protein